MPAPYDQFSAAQFNRSTTAPTAFTAPAFDSPGAPVAFSATAFAPSTTPPASFVGGVLADLAALRAVLTPTLSINPAAVLRVLSTTPGETVRAYQLEAGTTADNGDTVIRPTDYAAGTNERIWRRVL